MLTAGSLWLWIPSAVITLLFLFSVSRVDDVQAAILGGTLVFALLRVSGYYYGFLLIFCLWQSWESVDARTLALMGLLFFSASIAVIVPRAMGVPVSVRTLTATLGLLATFFVLFAQIHEWEWKKALRFRHVRL